MEASKGSQFSGLSQNERVGLETICFIPALLMRKPRAESL